MTADLELRVGLAEVLALERVDTDVLRTTYRAAGLRSLFGGQVAAQALAAAAATLGRDRLPHSLQCRFLRPGDETRPVLFRVDRDLDGRRFSARRVTAWQEGKALMTTSASFQVVAEAGPFGPVGECMVPTPGGPGPDCSGRFDELVRASRPEGADDDLTSGWWVGFREPVGDDPLSQACAQTFVADLMTADVPGWPADVEPGVSLDHVLWFHDLTTPSDRWFVETKLEASTHERYTCRGRLLSPSGRRATTFAQEALYVES